MNAPRRFKKGKVFRVHLEGHPFPVDMVSIQADGYVAGSGLMLVVLFALLAGSLVVFRRVTGRALIVLRQHWRWALLTVAGLSLVSGALVLWWP